MPEAIEVIELVSFKEACDAVRVQGCTNLWTLPNFEQAQCRTMTDEWIAAQDRMQQKKAPGKWQVRGRYLYFIRDSAPTIAVRVYYAA